MVEYRRGQKHKLIQHNGKGLPQGLTELTDIPATYSYHKKHAVLWDSVSRSDVLNYEVRIDRPTEPYFEVAQTAALDFSGQTVTPIPLPMSAEVSELVKNKLRVTVLENGAKTAFDLIISKQSSIPVNDVDEFRVSAVTKDHAVLEVDHHNGLSPMETSKWLFGRKSGKLLQSLNCDRHAGYDQGLRYLVCLPVDFSQFSPTVISLKNLQSGKAWQVAAPREGLRTEFSKFSPDGQWLAFGAGPLIWVLHVPSGKYARPLIFGDEAVVGVQFSQANTSLAAVGYRGLVKVFELTALQQTLRR